MTKNNFINQERSRVFNIKMGLEKTFIIDLKKYFAEQKRKVKAGKKIDSISNVLEIHYKRIVRKLTGKQIKQSENVIEIIAGRADIQAAEIDKTTRKEIEDSINLARDTLIDDGVTDYTQEILLLIASKIFLRKSGRRVGSISNTETQGVTEDLRNVITNDSIKELETVIIDNDKDRLDVIIKESPSYTAYEIKKGIDKENTNYLLGLLVLAQKSWQTMGDAKVRTSPFNHASANGQSVNLAEYFIVSGELMGFPGDMSMGASVGNIINCRCVCVYL